MTLHTRLAVTSPGIDPKEIFDLLLNLVGADAEQKALAEETKNGDGSASISMPMGLGLNALCWMDYRTDGELLTQDAEETTDFDEIERARAHNERLEEEGDGYDDYIYLSYAPPSYIVLHFDTAYSYKAPNGAECGDLHAWMIREIGKWLAEREASYSWYDESGYGWDAEREHKRDEWLGRDRISEEWGTLGDPDVGDPKSMIPSVTEDSRAAFLKTAMEALRLQQFERNQNFPF